MHEDDFKELAKLRIIKEQHAKFQTDITVRRP